MNQVRWKELISGVESLSLVRSRVSREEFTDEELAQEIRDRYGAEAGEWIETLVNFGLKVRDGMIPPESKGAA